MDNFRLLLAISRTHLTSRLKQTVIAALGVTFGIGAFIILMGFMTGLNSLLDGLILDVTPHVHIYNEIKPSKTQPVDRYSKLKNAVNIVYSVRPKQNQLNIHNALPIVKYLKKNPKVKGVATRVATKTFYLSGSIELNGITTGITPLEETRLFNFDDYVIEGSPNDLYKNNNGIILGAGIMNKTALNIGDRIRLSLASGEVLPLKIVGIYQSGLAEIDDVQSFVNLRTAQRMMGKGNSYITDINVKLFDVDQSVSMAQMIEERYRVSAKDINEANAQFETGSQIRNLITYSVSITLLVVAGFGIYNILNMLIYEKMNDIAILKATGFSGQDVKLIFIIQAMIIGLVGGLLGLLIGYGFSVLIDQIPFETDALPTIKTYPVNFDWLYYVTGILFALVSTFLAGYLPARKAEGIDPVEIIRGQ